MALYQDAEGKVVDTLTATKRRGVNRVSWSMQVKPPRVPRAAQVRLREHADILYGAILSWEGRPARYQVERIDALSRELGDIAKELDSVLASSKPREKRRSASGGSRRGLGATGEVRSFVG